MHDPHSDGLPIDLQHALNQIRINERHFRNVDGQIAQHGLLAPSHLTISRDDHRGKIQADLDRFDAAGAIPESVAHELAAVRRLIAQAAPVVRPVQPAPDQTTVGAVGPPRPNGRQRRPASTAAILLFGAVLALMITSGIAWYRSQVQIPTTTPQLDAHLPAGPTVAPLATSTTVLAIAPTVAPAATAPPTDDPAPTLPPVSPPPTIPSDTPPIPLQVGDIVGDGVPAPGAGYIKEPGEQDVYTLEVAAGQQIFFEVLAGELFINWSISDATGYELHSYPFNHHFMTFRDAGVYTITMNTGRNTPRYTYGFHVWDVPAAQVFPIQIGDTVAKDRPGPGAGYLATPGEQEIYTFEVTADQSVVFDPLESWIFTGWSITDPHGLILYDRRMETHQMELYTPGTYTLTVNSGHERTVGAYSFRLTPSP